MRSQIFILLSMVGMSLSQQNQAQTVRRYDAQLTPTILSEQYCNTPAGRALFLKVRLELVNKGPDPFEVTVPLSGVTIVSRSLADAANGKHEAEMHGAENVFASPSEGTMPQPERKQVNSGQRIELIDEDVQVFVSGGSAPHKPSLKLGRHYLQIQIDAFPPGTRMEEMISSVRRINSVPVPIFVKANPGHVPVCSELFKHRD